MDQLREADTVELIMVCHDEDETSIFVSDTGELEDGVSLPLSQVRLSRLREDFIDIALPVGLAKERGLI